MTTTSSTGGRIVTNSSGLTHYCNLDHQPAESDKFLANEVPKFDFSALLASAPLTAQRTVDFE